MKEGDGDLLEEVQSETFGRDKFGGGEGKEKGEKEGKEKGEFPPPFQATQRSVTRSGDFSSEVSKFSPPRRETCSPPPARSPKPVWEQRSTQLLQGSQKKVFSSFSFVILSLAFFFFFLFLILLLEKGIASWFTSSTAKQSKKSVAFGLSDATKDKDKVSPGDSGLSGSGEKNQEIVAQERRGKSGEGERKEERDGGRERVEEGGDGREEEEKRGKEGENEKNEKRGDGGGEKREGKRKKEEEEGEEREGEREGGESTISKRKSRRLESKDRAKKREKEKREKERDKGKEGKGGRGERGERGGEGGEREEMDELLKEISELKKKVANPWHIEAKNVSLTKKLGSGACGEVCFLFSLFFFPFFFSSLSSPFFIFLLSLFSFSLPQKKMNRFGRGHIWDKMWLSKF